MARPKKRVEECYYYPRIRRFETGKIDPKYLNDPNVNSREEGYADSPRFHAIHQRQLERQRQGSQDDSGDIIIINPSCPSDCPTLVDVLTPEEELFLKPDSNINDEIQHPPISLGDDDDDDEEPDSLFT